MLNGIQERGMNKDENIKVKIWEYPGASSIDILDHIKPSLRKAPEQILIHAGTNDISNNTNYLNNVKKFLKLVKETCKDTKLSLSSVICCNDVKDITDTINTTNSHLENYCKQQNVGFINNRNLKKSDLNSKGLHLNERSSNKFAKKLLDFIYGICKPGSSISCQSEVSGNCCVNKALRHFKSNHPQYVSLGYLNINSVRNKFYSIPPLIEHNIDIFASAEIIRFFIP